MEARDAEVVGLLREIRQRLSSVETEFATYRTRPVPGSVAGIMAALGYLVGDIEARVGRIEERLGGQA
jgi:hypothetical protein